LATLFPPTRAATSTPAALPGRYRWVETSTATGDTITPRQADAFVLLLQENNDLTMTTDCNRIGGRYTYARSGRFVVTELSMTEMGCPNAQDTVVADMLSTVTGYELRDTTLTFTLAGDGRMRLVRE